MSDLHFAVPSSRTLILSLFFALVLLVVIRTALFAISSLSTASSANDKLTQRQTGEAVHQDESSWLPSISLRKWCWKLDSLPLSSPISISIPHHEVAGNETGMSSPSPPIVEVNLRSKSAGPAFDHPLPAIYETETPVSMAKMIMSRHTSRPPRPPRRVTGPAARRVQSMV